MELNAISKIIVSIAVGTTFFICSANAGIIIEKPVKRIADNSQDQIRILNGPMTSSGSEKLFPKRRSLEMESYVTERISQSGERPFNIPVTRGVGRKVALRESLSQILPIGWKVFTDGPVDITRRFDWAGEKIWVLILHSILETNSLNAYVDWTNKEITIFNQQTKLENGYRDSQIASRGDNRLSEDDISRIANAIRKTENQQSPSTRSSRDIVVERELEYVTHESTKEKSTQLNTWVMSPDKTVKENLEEWTSKVPGWRLVWSARTGEHIFDYPSKPFVGYAFKGELMGIAGVISRVVATFADSNPPLAVEFFLENKVVEISLYKTSQEQNVSDKTKNDARNAIGK